MFFQVNCLKDPSTISFIFLIPQSMLRPCGTTVLLVTSYFSHSDNHVGCRYFEQENDWEILHQWNNDVFWISENPSQIFEKPKQTAGTWNCTRNSKCGWVDTTIRNTDIKNWKDWGDWFLLTTSVCVKRWTKKSTNIHQNCRKKKRRK